LKLGTKRHHERYLEGIDSLDDVGCFGLTELGYGNNAVEMETTAEYVAKEDSFVVHTPTPLAQKYWITNGAVHAKHVVVFARLLVNGQNEGIHGVLVRIRDDDLKVMPGVTVEDMGHKMGLNGVDNAKVRNKTILRESKWISHSCPSTKSACPGRTCLTVSRTWTTRGSSRRVSRALGPGSSRWQISSSPVASVSPA